MNKTLLATTLASLILSSGTLSAAEAEVVHSTLKQLPALKSIEDRALLQSFLEENLEQLSPETVEVLSVLSVERRIAPMRATLRTEVKIKEFAADAMN